jgi:uncharacterized protein (TIGR00156 family)
MRLSGRVTSQVIVSDMAKGRPAILDPAIGLANFARRVSSVARITSEKADKAMPTGFNHMFHRGRTVSLAAACFAALLVIPVHAQFFGGNSSVVNTVADATRAPARSRVVLTGTLQKELRRAQYQFKDATGTIRVRIEREFWRGREVTKNMTLKLRGKVESDVRGRFIDVYYFQIVE